MKKSFLYYAICWGCLVALFNLTYFVVWNDGGLKPSYGFVTAAFVAHLLFIWFVSLKNNEGKILFFISSMELLVMTIVGILCMIIPCLINEWGTIVCGIVFGVSMILLVIAKVVGENTENANNKLNETTSYYRELLAKSQKVLGVAKTAEVRVIAEKVVEAIRYSDPMSNEVTHSLEMIIDDNVNQLYEAIKKSESIDCIKTKSDELLCMIADRNNICKTQKRY